MTGLVAALLLASNVSSPPLDQLYWLAGCWEQTSDSIPSLDHT